MKELEDTKCEIRRTIDLQFSISDRLNATQEEDGGTLGSAGYNSCANPLGGFFKDPTYAWISCGPRLVVINIKTGTSISSWTFKYRVTCVSQFPTQPGQIPLLLIGLDNEANKVRDSSGLVCIFDCTTSQVLRAIRTPAGVEQACVVFGGAEWEDFGNKRIDNVLGEGSGMACVALRNLDHLMIDLRRTSWEGLEATLFVDEASPAELDFTESNERTSNRRRSGREKHAAYNLMNSRLEQYIGFNREEYESSSIYQESLTSSLICSQKIGCLVSGCLGRIIIWQTDGDVRWISGPLDESMSITHLALLEPTDDPRPFCYLWLAYQEETCRSPPFLRMYAMLFERKYTDKGSNSYFNLETDPSVKFELELDDNERITSICPIVRDSNSEQTDPSYKRGEDSLLLIRMETRAILFDLNQWYKEQMPQTIGDCNNPNAIVANYPTRPEIHDINDDTIINCAYIPETLSEFSCNCLTPSEEIFYPNSLSLEWIDLNTSRLTFWMTRGLQAELLREISITGPVILIEPTEIFHRCVSAGLVSTVGEYSINTDKDQQREIILSLCLEQRWSTFLLKCATEWSDGSASYLFHAFLRWGMQRASSIKLTADRLSVPLYDQSGTDIGETEVKQLRFCCQQLECISNVVTNLHIDSVNLTKERLALRRVSTYLQVLLWFYDVGLLPETQEIEDEEATLPMAFSLKIPYPYEKLATIYREKREEFAKNSTKNSKKQEEDMFIDELVTRECSQLKSQWEREGGELSIGGYYPPSSLQSLLRSYLTDCHNNPDLNEMDNKHQITIYLLMDLAMLLQSSCPGVNQLIKYPSAFKLSPSLIKLTQALWLLDHEDYHGFLDMMTGQLVSDSDVKDWHHKLVMRTLIRNNQNKLALIYLRVRKPPLSSIDDQSTVINLSVEHGLVQSAFHHRPASHYAQLLTSFYRACKKHDRLNDILHLALDHEEEEIFVKFLENEKIEDTRLLYYLQRCRYAEASNVCPRGSIILNRGNYQKNNDMSASLTILNAYNATLPNITRKFSLNIGGKISDMESNTRYPRPMSHSKSRVKMRDIHDIVMKKARETFLRCDRARIPFVSAPCSTLTSQSNNVDTHAVMFIDKLETLSGKRSLDEMRGDDCTIIDSKNNRKRRRIGDSNENIESDITEVNNEIGTNIIFSTPLVKRKNQMINPRNTTIETPHSILKIRQLIRESTSPCQTDGLLKETNELNIHERERRRRQIRFSLVQQEINDESSGDTRLLDDNVETAKNHDENDVTAENEKNLANDEISEEEEIEEAYYSPNIIKKSYYEPTLLSDTTSVTINVTGPRPRPSLRRSSESTLSNDNHNRTINLSTESTGIRNKLSFTFNEDTRNNVTSTSMVENVNQFSETAYTASILSSDTSFERTLPTKWTLPDSNQENTFSFSEKSIRKDVSAPAASSIERSENFRKFNQITMRRSLIRKSKVFEEFTDDIDEDKNSEVLMEVDGFGLDRESSNQSTTKNIWNTDNNVDRMENIGAFNTLTETLGVTDEENLFDQRKEERDEDNENKEMEQNERNSLKPQVTVNEEIYDSVRENEQSDDKSQTNEEDNDKFEENENDEYEIEENVDDSTKQKIPTSKNVENCTIEMKETVIVKTMDDCDDGMLALRYEEEEDDDSDNDNTDEGEDENEMYQSLSNSVEIVAERSKSSSEESIISSVGNDKLIKKSTNLSTNNGFYDVPIISNEEANITDDESSRSVDGSALNVGSAETKIELEKTLSLERTLSLEKTLSVEKIQSDIINEASNMTNDDSSSSFDSSLFSVKKSNQDLTRMTNTFVDVKQNINENDSSHDSPLFSSKKPQKLSKDTEKNNDTEKPSEIKKKMSFSSCRIDETPTSNTTDNDISEITDDVTEAKCIDKSKLEESPRVKRDKKIIENMDTTKRSNNPAVETVVTTPLRMTRSRRASSVVQEQSPMPESPVTRSSTTARLRRASSLAKDFVTSVNEESIDTMEIKPDSKTSKLRRSISLVKDLTPVQSRNIEKAATSQEKEIKEMEEEKMPIGRRTKRATSLQKDISVPTRTKITRSSSKNSLSEDNIEEASTSRKTITTRAKKSSTTNKETNIVPKRLTRSSSLVKDIPEMNDDLTSTRRATYKRGSSLPKEITLEKSTRPSLQKIRRGSSLSKDVIPEESNENMEETKRERGISSLRNKMSVERTKSSSPTPSTRIRLSSITSILEEKEKENENEESDNEIFTWKGKSTENIKNTRLRRAASVDLPQVGVKRKTRAALVRSASIINEPIEEETFETETTSERKTKLTKKAPVRRKRTTSATTSREDLGETIFETLPARRTRNLSQKSNDGENFHFSPPDKAHDRPNIDDEKDLEEIHDYIFSPPHTRSRHITPQPQK